MFQYVVQPGDTLWSIANRFGTTVQAIMQANNLTSGFVFTGQTLLIPRQFPGPGPGPFPGPTPGPGPGQGIPAQIRRLENRVDRLEREVNELNRRVRRLEGGR